MHLVSSTFTSAFGRAVAAERTFKGISQLTLAEALGWKAASNISAIESGERVFPVGLLPELCEALGCSVLDLLKRANPRDRQKMGL